MTDTLPLTDQLRSRYLHLLKHSLTDTIHAVTYTASVRSDGQVELFPLAESERQPLEEGHHWPAFGETMVGLRRLEHLQVCLEDVIREQVPGDVIEAGVWRGGASIFMKAVLESHQQTDRKLWLADNFGGFPQADLAQYPQDVECQYDHIPFLSISEEEVRANFRRYGVLDDQVRFLKGHFKKTLPTLKDEQFALLRLDGDMYESTLISLRHLYPRLAVGGYVILDDYGVLPPCREAVLDYRRQHGIEDELITIDWTGAFWKKTS